MTVAATIQQMQGMAEGLDDSGSIGLCRVGRERQGGNLVTGMLVSVEDPSSPLKGPNRSL